jgi:hypothetical protein
VRDGVYAVIAEPGAFDRQWDGCAAASQPAVEFADIAEPMMFARETDIDS